ncbi:TPA: restriction endonuclease subunit S [Vibrio vulnificus]|uniref:restriction endonuclease subunit S n=1 Tax=Vibrio TaxID=662 RepID=UPI001B835BCB|nr:restriction endonuclease subunit S [Vibrio parahaemolyticus]HDY7621436.1 restriction endonuclease subunit S [Vibrio vulnificus]ELB2890040.1 restriction endonuclease subunit S [Vibrio parahaemolyticus]MDF4615055.1 restriction endonuclease subunit S [Vibrio parahaemolyticus]MDF4761941.1 restriction endonuclease subunit S [Vibrio parahaemolyticus]MDF4986482.1 restriction endonuclease subunit S [Vibrio parahaemolyticus]
MDNWRDSKIEELCTLHYGKSPKGIDSDDGIYPIYGTGGIVGSTNDYLYDKPSIILGRKGSIGNIHYVDKPFWTIDTTFYVEAKNCDTKWLYYIFSSLNIEKLNEATGVPSLSRNNIYAQMLKAPSDQKEQQKIAEVLSTVDKKIDLIDQKIAETEKLKTGLMQKLFSEGVGVQEENGEWQPHTEFQDNGLPMHWSFLKLGSVAKVTSGGTPSRKKASFWENGTIPWITTGEVNFNCITNSSQKITDEGLKNSAAKMFPPDTILMAMYGQGQTRGRVAMLGIEASTNQACAAIICSKKLNPHFCYHYLSSQYEKIRAIGNEGSQKNLNGQIIKDILIPCPNLEEQEQIALVLSTVDEKITLLAKQKSETQQLKKGLMQKLLTGEWRVPVEETEAA